MVTTPCGGNGLDTMVGGSGDDTYVVNHVNDVVTELPSGGTDLIQSSVSYTASSDVENLILQVLNITATKYLSNELNGNNGSNNLYGKEGNALSGGQETILLMVGLVKILCLGGQEMTFI